MACVLYHFKGNGPGEMGQARRITSESSNGSCKSGVSLGTEGKGDQRVDICNHYQDCVRFKAQ